MLTDAGRIKALRCIVGLDAIETYDMMLFTNNYTVIESTVLGDLTEVAVAGYARQTLSGWAAPVGPVAGTFTSVAANVTFTNSSGGNATIYGWAYIGHTTGTFYGGGNFGAPLTLLAAGTLVFSPGWNDNTN